MSKKPNPFPQMPHVDNRRWTEKVTSTFFITAWAHATLFIALRLVHDVDISWGVVLILAIGWIVLWTAIHLTTSYICFLKDRVRED